MMRLLARRSRKYSILLQHIAAVRRRRAVRKAALRRMARRYARWDRWASDNVGCADDTWLRMLPCKILPSCRWRCRVCLGMLGVFWERHDSGYRYTPGYSEAELLRECSEKNMRDVFAEDQSYRLVLQFFYAGGDTTLRKASHLAAESMIIAYALHDQVLDLPMVIGVIRELDDMLGPDPFGCNAEPPSEAVMTRILGTIRRLVNAYPVMKWQAHISTGMRDAHPTNRILFRRSLRFFYTADTALCDLEPKNIGRAARRLRCFYSVRGVHLGLEFPTVDSTGGAGL